MGRLELALLIFAVWTIASFRCVFCNAEAPVDGDRDLLRAIRDAQRTNLAQFPRGQMHARIQSRIIGLDIDTTAIWDGPMTFWDYTLVEPSSGAGPTGKNERTRTEKARVIDDGATKMFYWPDIKFAQIVSDRNGPTYRDQLKIRPDEFWFTLEAWAGGHRTWAQMLDPDVPGLSELRFVVRPEGTDNVLIEMHGGKGRMLRIVASPAKGGNIVSYESRNERLSDGGTRFWRRGTYDWAQDPNGHWYLKRHEFQNSASGTPDELDWDGIVEIDSFNPDPVIPPNRFKFESLEVAAGTTVENVGAERRTYRVGEETRGVMEGVLRTLAEKLRDASFIKRADK